jgi:hypothetical protein
MMSGSITFGITFEPENEIHRLLDESMIRQKFDTRAFGSTYRAEFTGEPVITGKDTDSVTFSVMNIEIIEITPENFHEGAD